MGLKTPLRTKEITPSLPFTPSLLLPTEGTPTQSDGARYGASGCGAVRKEDGQRWTAGAALHQCWPGHHGPVMSLPQDPCCRAPHGPPLF